MGVVVGGSVWLASDTAGDAANGGTTQASAGSVIEARPTSTPVSEWRQGSVPYLYQTDAAWADEPYAGGTVGTNGCGPTSMAMVYVCLTGKTNLDPAAMCRLAEAGGYVYDGATTWTFMTEGAAQIGLVGEELPADVGVVTDALAAGQPIICSMRPGDFTQSGHFIVLAGLDEDGQVIVRDPNSEQRSHQTWDAQRVISQCANIWAFSVA